MIVSYRKIVGKAMFYCTKIAPELCFVTGLLARFMHNPGEEHWKALDRLVGYLKAKAHHELILRRPRNLSIISFGDSSFGDCPDTRRSTGGGIHTIGGCLLNWNSQRQRTVTTSSCEAEYVAMSELAKEQKFLQMLVKELTNEEPTGKIYYDNEASEFLAKNKQVSTRSKHIEVRYHFIREFVEEERSILEHVNTEKNYADIMTKNLPVKQFLFMSERILKGFIDDDAAFSMKLDEILNCIVDFDHNQRENVKSDILEYVGLGNIESDQGQNEEQPRNENERK
jgi:hypothetical protein